MTLDLNTAVEALLKLFRPIGALLTEVRTLRRQRRLTQNELRFKVLEEKIEHARLHYHRLYAPPPKPRTPRRTYPHSPGQLQLEPIRRDLCSNPAWREKMDRQKRERDRERDKAAAVIQKLRDLHVYLSYSQERLWPCHLDVLRDLSHSANLREARNMFPDTHSPTQRFASGH